MWIMVYRNNNNKRINSNNSSNQQNNMNISNQPSHNNSNVHRPNKLPLMLEMVLHDMPWWVVFIPVCFMDHKVRYVVPNGVPCLVVPWVRHRIGNPLADMLKEKR